MKVTVEDKIKEIKIQGGDIFYSTATENFQMLTRIDINNRYTLVSLNSRGSRYDDVTSLKSFKDITTQINKYISTGELIHYSTDQYVFELNIKAK